MANKKVQIQLLNENTGAVIEDVDPITSAATVLFQIEKHFNKNMMLIN